MQASFLFQMKRRQLQVEASIKHFEQHIKNTSFDEEFLKVMTMSTIGRKFWDFVNKVSSLNKPLMETIQHTSKATQQN